MSDARCPIPVERFPVLALWDHLQCADKHTLKTLTRNDFMCVCMSVFVDK